jgi:hypothetical protein
MSVIYYGTFDSIAGNTYTVELLDGPGVSVVGLLTSYENRVTINGGIYEGGTCLEEAIKELSGSTELRLASPGFTIDRQGENDTFFDNHVRPSRCTAFFVIDSDATQAYFEGIAQSPENTYVVRIYRDSELFYLGQVVADQMRFDRKDPDGKVIFELVSVDGLNLLTGFKVEDSWFTNERADGVSILLNCLTNAGLDEYFATGDDYLLDGLRQFENTYQSVSDQKLAYFSFHKLSFVKDYDPFKDGAELDYIDVNEALAQIMQAFGARLLFDQGKYVVTQPNAYQSASVVFHKYTKGGTYNSTETVTHGVTLGTLPARPQWEAFPKQYYQPPVKRSKLDITKQNGIYDIKTAFDTSTFSTTYSDWTYPLNFRVRVDVEAQAPTKASVNQLSLFYRAYIFDGTDYWQFWQTWTNSGPTLPDWSEEIIKRPYYSKKRWPHTMVQDFESPGSWANGLEFVYEIYCAEFNPAYVKIGGSKGWTSPGYTDINFSGKIVISEAYNNVEPIPFSKDIFTVSNNVNSGNSIEFVQDFKYYDGKTFDTGTILAYDGADWQKPIIWGVGWQAGYFKEFSQVYADQITSVYSKYLPAIYGTWHDGGNLSAYKTLSFDGGTWLLNGCTYEAQFETWDGEWLKIGAVYNDVISTGEEENYKPSERVYFENEIKSIRDELSRLNSVQGLAYEYVMQDIIYHDTYAPTSDPGVNASYSVGLGYNASETEFTWQVKRVGYSETVTSDITSGFPVEKELFLCDTSGGSITISLPVPSDVPGLRYGFVKTESTHSLTLDAGVGYQINDAQLKSWSARFETYWVQSDGTQWYIVASDK